MATAEATVAPVETVAETTTKVKTKVEKTGDLIADIAIKVEGLSKTKALHEAVRLAETVETSYLELGGVLNLIKSNSWFEGSSDFDTFVLEKFGFKPRKAHYLISIYLNLVTKQIPWDKVKDLGWSKLKELAPVITLETVDVWVEKASKLTVLELQKLLATTKEGKEETAKITDDLVKMTFKLKSGDQAETVQSALAKAKGELQTEFDTVALENICAGYLGGNTAVAPTGDFATMAKSMGFEAAMEKISEIYPEWDIAATEHVDAPGSTDGAQVQGEQQA